MQVGVPLGRLVFLAAWRSSRRLCCGVEVRRCQHSLLHLALSSRASLPSRSAHLQRVQLHATSHRRMLSYSVALRSTEMASSHTPTTPDITIPVVDTGSVASAVDALETSAQARWAADAAQVVTAAELPAQGDFASLGLGSWHTPVGIIQSALEYLHCSLHLPWWVAIIASTVVLRTLILPIAVRIQANAVKLNNIRLETEGLMAKIKKYNKTGDKVLAAQQSAKLMALYKKHGCNPLKMLLMPVIQVPVFISYFIAIRKMAAVPVESMKTGGILWFTDLTVSDPYYILPCLGCVSFLAIMEFGGEAGITTPQAEKMKNFFRVMGIVLIPVTSTFPAGLFMYWLTASVFSMGQILLLRLPRVRDAFGIPELVNPPSPAEFQKAPGFIASVKDNYRNAVVVDQVKRKNEARKKVYNKMVKNPTGIKLYDKPPHLRDAKQ